MLIYQLSRPPLLGTLIVALSAPLPILIWISALWGLPGSVFVGLEAMGAALLMYLPWVLSFRKLSYAPDRRELILETRGLFFTPRRKVFPASQFSAIVSFCAWGGRSNNYVYLLEPAGGKGLSVGTFELTYKYRAFWNPLPQILESPDAAELRQRLAPLLGVVDQGYVGVRPIPSQSRAKPAPPATGPHDP